MSGSCRGPTLKGPSILAYIVILVPPAVLLTILMINVSPKTRHTLLQGDLPLLSWLVFILYPAWWFFLAYISGTMPY
jgi:hypothetical protein